ncbi:uncharacterized protein lcorl isoform X2 [Betta splendens]|nr:uncharacterized protein lcorl isoform X2 [Betta splendens]XP_055368975.1 uncharacterized protein lcorl isoform X2 [Betta splendens]
MLLRDLNLFDDCEPEEVEDWSPESSCSQCSFCNLLLDKLNDQVPAALSPLSSPSDYSPCLISESSQSAHRFLQAVFHKKDVSLGCDSNIPLVAQELMKKMIHQFALEYASKCLLHPSTNGVMRTPSPLLETETSDAPLDLTVCRSQEEKESHPELDGVLDLSNRNAATSSSLSNHNGTGSLLQSENMGDLGHRGTKRHQTSVLDAVLSSLCPAHSSLLHKILKMAQHEKRLSFLNHKPVGQMESYCSRCGVNPHDSVNTLAVPLSECKSHNHKPCYPLTDCDHQGHGSTFYHPGDSKSNCNIPHYPLKDCKSKSSAGSSYSCVQRCRMETYTALCPKRLHCASCLGHISKVVCPFASTRSSMCSPSSMVCCNQHNCHFCPCYSKHMCLMQVRNSQEIGFGDQDPPCPVLKMEQSPSPPPLSPVSSDISKKMDENPPFLLHHGHEVEAEQIVRNYFMNSIQHKADGDTTTEEGQQYMTTSQAERNQSRTLLQDVLNRFSKTIDTIRPLDKDQEQPQSPSQSLQCPGDAHLTEIITKVLHKGSASDYNLSDLFNQHDSNEPKSPNTRSRRRQEVLAAIATPVDDASNRRKVLKIKRELAMLDHNRERNVPPVKRSRLKDGNVLTVSDLNPNKETEREMKEDVESTENHRIRKRPPNVLSAAGGRDEGKGELRTVITTEDVKILEAEGKQIEKTSEETYFTLSATKIPTLEFRRNYSRGECQQAQISASSAKLSGGESDKGVEGSDDEGGKNHKPAPLAQNLGRNSEGKVWPERQKDQMNHSKDERRSKRNIVPPQRFSSYVTEPRMFFVARFDDGILNRRSILPSSPLDDSSKGPCARVPQLESRHETPLSPPEHTESLALEAPQRKQCRPSHTKSKGHIAQSVATRGRGHAAQQASSDTPPNPLDVNVGDSSATCAEGPASPPTDYTSPIKLMFVSPVEDKKGVRYSLKSAASGSSAQAEEHFDPCEVSSWSGSPEKHKNHSTESGTSLVKTTPSPSKSASSPTGSASLPTKSASPPSRSVSSPGKYFPSKPKSPSSPANSSSPRSKSMSSPAKSSTSKSSPSSPAKSTSSASPSPKPKSPKSASSSPKIGSRRNGETTPTKRVAGPDSQRSPCDLPAFHETTPPKRRPGRPKKLGPQLEQKVKRPIGRPRKQKAVDSVIGSKTVEPVVASDIEENVNKNLKITVVYGRSRRHKRMVSECFDKLQTDFHDAWQAAALKSDLRISMCSSTKNPGGTEATSTEELTFVSPVKECATQSSSNIKCHKGDNGVPSRKPGRPAKVKISGISVTVTAVSPRQRKIQINRDNLQSLETPFQKKKSRPELKPAKSSGASIAPPISKICESEKGVKAQDDSISQVSNQAVRHSMRVRKPSIHFLHALATSTSRSYSHSNALLRRSKQLLLNKASNERKKEEQQSSLEPSWGREQLCGHGKTNVPQDLSRVAGVSIDSIFNPKETLRWWPPAAEEQSMNQELARRIRLISDTWVSDTVENQEREMTFDSTLDDVSDGSFVKTERSSVVRALFDCSPNKPRSCSMQQLSSWFMETTETQSLAIVKKTSSRNPFELMHFPRSVNKKSVCHSPQAERLRRHIKKFAKTVPKSPSQHQKAQRRLQRNSPPLAAHKQQVFGCQLAKGNAKHTVLWWRRGTFSRYQATVVRAKTRFCNQKERERFRNKQRNENRFNATGRSNGPAGNELQSKHGALHRSVKRNLSEYLVIDAADQIQGPVDVPKEQNICSKAWSPETLKECRVFLRKINSPDSESAEEEWDSCTVTLDDGSPPAYLFAGGARKLVGVVKAVKTEERNMNSRTASREPVGPEPKSAQGQSELPAGRQRGKYKGPGAVASEPQPAKMLRQSRVRGLTGPRWCDFVFEN